MQSLKRIGFFSAFIVPALVITGYYGGGWWNFLYLAFDFVTLPIIDYIVGLDRSNVPDIGSI